MSYEEERCPICSETRTEGWDVCPACGHPYPVSEAELSIAIDAERRRLTR